MRIISNDFIVSFDYDNVVDMLNLSFFDYKFNLPLNASSYIVPPTDIILISKLHNDYLNNISDMIIALFDSCCILKHELAVNIIAFYYLNKQEIDNKDDLIYNLNNIHKLFGVMYEDGKIIHHPDRKIFTRECQSWWSNKNYKIN